MSTKLPTALVVKLAENGYGVVRSLAVRGIPLAGVYTEATDFGRFSRYCRAEYLPACIRESELICQQLMKLARRLRTKPVLFPTADHYVWAIARHSEEMSKHFLFHWVDAEVLTRIVDKAQMAEVCARAGVLTPRTHVTRPDENIVASARAFAFPCLIKPNRSFNSPFPAELKNVVVESEEELLAFYEAEPSLKGATLWQEIIEGGDENIFQCTVLVRQNGELGAAFCARKLYQCPPGYGVMAYGRSEFRPELLETTLLLLRFLGYRGLASLEFKFRPSDGRFYFIEMNPRLPWYNSLFADAGVNLAYLAYSDLIGQADPPWVGSQQRDGLHWASFNGVLAWYRLTRRQKRVGPLSLFRPLARARSFPWWNRRDPKPFLRAMLSLGGLGLQRLSRVLSLPQENTGRAAPRRSGADVLRRDGSAMSPLQVKKYESWEELQHLQPSWNEFAEQTCSPTIFLTREWLRSWWSAYGGSQELAILAWFDRNQELVALAPLYRRRRRVWGGISLRELRFVGDGSGDSDNLDLLVRPGYEGAVVESFLDWLVRHRSGWDLLNLNLVPGESHVLRTLCAALEERRWARLQRQSPHGVIPLTGDWEAYLQTLSRNTRYQIRSRLRRLQNQYEVRLRRCQSDSELAEFLAALFELHRKRWNLRGESGTLHRPERRRLYAEVIPRALAQGWLDFWLLDLNGSAVAAHLGFRYRETHYFLQGGFDPAYAPLSVGFVLTSLVLQELIRQRASTYDFLGGQEPYKSRWQTEWRSYHHLSCAPPFSRGALHLGMLKSAEGAKGRLRRQLPAAAWSIAAKVYHRLAWHGDGVEVEESLRKIGQMSG